MIRKKWKINFVTMAIIVVIVISAVVYMVMNVVCGKEIAMWTSIAFFLVTLAFTCHTVIEIDEVVRKDKCNKELYLSNKLY